MNRRLLLVGVGVLILVLAVLTAAGALPDPTHTADFCAGCHVDIRESHASGAHSEMACVDCHVPSGLAGQVVGRWDGARHLRLTWTQDPRSGHQPPIPRVTDTACLGCHERQKLSDKLVGEDLAKLHRSATRLPKLGLKTNHAGHETARADCRHCHAPTRNPQSRDPLACITCHQTVGHVRERTARARSFGHEPALPVPSPPTPPPPPVDPDEGEDEEWLEEPTDLLRCTPRGIQRCGPCHNGRSHGNGTKPRSLPNILKAGSTFTCRRCHHKGRF